LLLTESIGQPKRTRPKHSGREPYPLIATKSLTLLASILYLLLRQAVINLLICLLHSVDLLAMLYVVQVTNTDTLASIAAQFDTTTSTLKKSNRLMSDMVIPGKVIWRSVL